VDIDATLYPLTLADHKPVPRPGTLGDPPRELTEVEKKLGLFPGEELDVSAYKGVSPLQQQEQEALRRARFWRLKHT
jgi:hypothetical protein